jgi:hypothetical protein
MQDGTAAVERVFREEYGRRAVVARAGHELVQEVRELLPGPAV